MRRVPSSSINSRSIVGLIAAVAPDQRRRDFTREYGACVCTPRPSASRSSRASCAPVDAPAGATPRPTRGAGAQFHFDRRPAARVVDGARDRSVDTGALVECSHHGKNVSRQSSMNSAIEAGGSSSRRTAVVRTFVAHLLVQVFGRRFAVDAREQQRGHQQQQAFVDRLRCRGAVRGDQSSRRFVEPRTVPRHVRRTSGTDARTGTRRRRPDPPNRRTLRRAGPAGARCGSGCSSD